MVTTDRHGLRRPIFMQFLLLIFFITLDGRYDGSSHAQWSIEGVRSKTLELLEFGYLDYFSDFHDEPAGWTVMATIVRQLLCNPTLGKNSPSSFSSCTPMPPTDRHEHDKQSEAP